MLLIYLYIFLSEKRSYRHNFYNFKIKMGFILFFMIKSRLLLKTKTVKNKNTLANLRYPKNLANEIWLTEITTN